MTETGAVWRKLAVYAGHMGIYSEKGYATIKYNHGHPGISGSKLPYWLRLVPLLVVGMLQNWLSTGSVQSLNCSRQYAKLELNPLPREMNDA